MRIVAMLLILAAGLLVTTFASATEKRVAVGHKAADPKLPFHFVYVNHRADPVMLEGMTPGCLSGGSRALLSGATLAADCPVYVGEHVGIEVRVGRPPAVLCYQYAVADSEHKATIDNRYSRGVNCALTTAGFASYHISLGASIPVKITVRNDSPTTVVASMLDSACRPYLAVSIAAGRFFAYTCGSEELKSAEGVRINATVPDTSEMWKGWWHDGTFQRSHGDSTITGSGNAYVFTLR